MFGDIVKVQVQLLKATVSVIPPGKITPGALSLGGTKGRISIAPV